MIHPEELDVNLYFDVVIDEAGFESSRELASAKSNQVGLSFRLVWYQPREDKILGESLSKSSPLLAVKHTRTQTSERPSQALF